MSRYWPWLLMVVVAVVFFNAKWPIPVITADGGGARPPETHIGVPAELGDYVARLSADGRRNYLGFQAVDIAFIALYSTALAGGITAKARRRWRFLSIAPISAAAADLAENVSIGWRVLAHSAHPPPPSTCFRWPRV